MQVLLIFSKEDCMRVRVPLSREGIWRISLWEEVVFTLQNIEGNWYLQENILSENAPVYYKMGGLELCLFLSKETEDLKVLGRMRLKQGESFKIGSSYQNHIFYQCFSFVEGVQAEILWEENGYILIKHSAEGLYLNGRVAEERRKLKEGDVIDLYGLHMVMLKEVLILCLFQGVGRVAKRDAGDADAAGKGAEAVTFTHRELLSAGGGTACR